MADDGKITVSEAHYTDLVRAAAARVPGRAACDGCWHAPYDCRAHRDPLHWCRVCRDALVFPERARYGTVVPYACPYPGASYAGASYAGASYAGASYAKPPVRRDVCPMSAPDSEPTFRCG